MMMKKMMMMQTPMMNYFLLLSDVCSVNTSRQSSRHNSGHSSHSSKKLKSYRNSEDLGDPSAAPPLVVRTSQSGIIPDTPGPLPEISGLIPDNADIDPTFQSWISGSHHRTTKSGILVENPITRAGIHDAELVAKDDTENDDDD